MYLGFQHMSFLEMELIITNSMQLQLTNWQPMGDWDTTTDDCTTQVYL